MSEIVEIDKYRLNIMKNKIRAFYVMSHIIDKFNKLDKKTLRIKVEDLANECHMTKEDASEAMLTCRKALSWSIQLEKDTFMPMTLCRQPTLKELNFAIYQISRGLT